MSSDVDIDRALAVITSTMNDQKLDHLDSGRVQEIITTSLGSETNLAVGLLAKLKVLGS